MTFGWECGGRIAVKFVCKQFLVRVKHSTDQTRPEPTRPNQTRPAHTSTFCLSFLLQIFLFMHFVDVFFFLPMGQGSVFHTSNRDLDLLICYCCVWYRSKYHSGPFFSRFPLQQVHFPAISAFVCCIVCIYSHRHAPSSSASKVVTSQHLAHFF